jgi:hypothetical protein
MMAGRPSLKAPAPGGGDGVVHVALLAVGFGRRPVQRVEPASAASDLVRWQPRPAVFMLFRSKSLISVSG